MIDMFLNVFDALPGQGMGAQIGIPPRFGEQILVLENAEELEQTLRRLAGGVEKAETGLVGLGFLFNRILQDRALTAPGAAGEHTGGALAAGRGSSCSAQHHGDDALDRCVVQCLLGAGEMPAGDVPGLVSGNADDLAWTLATNQQPGMEEEDLPPATKGVHTRLLAQL